MNVIFNVIGFGLSASLLLLSSCFKVSFMVGSQHGFFSAADMLSPLAGSLGCVGVLGMFLIRCGLSSGSSLFFLYHLPSLVGAWYWFSTTRLVHQIIPLGCMAAFWAHPVGSQAWGYALLWLVPLLVFHVKSSNLLVRALGCTFVVHAVGSILWLYTVPMTAGQWWALIPVVLVERALFACGLTVSSLTLNFIAKNMPYSIPVYQILTKGSR